MLQTVAKITQALRRHPFSHTGNYHIINYRKDHTSIAKPPISPCRELLNLPCRKDHTSIATPTISPYRQPSKFPWPQSSHKHCDTTMSINHQKLHLSQRPHDQYIFLHLVPNYSPDTNRWKIRNRKILNQSPGALSKTIRSRPCSKTHWIGIAESHAHYVIPLWIMVVDRMLFFAPYCWD